MMNYGDIAKQTDSTYLNYKKIKETFKEIGFFLENYVVYGGEVTRNIIFSNRVDVSSSIIALDREVTLREGTTFETSTPNSVYYLDFSEGDFTWGSIHPIESYVSIAEVTTDSNGMVDEIIDKRVNVGGIRFRGSVFGDGSEMETETSTQVKINDAVSMIENTITTVDNRLTSQLAKKANQLELNATKQELTETKNLANEANAKASDPLSAISLAGYKISPEDVSDELKQMMLGNTPLTEARGAIENNRGVEYPLKNVVRDGVIYPFQENVKNLILDVKVIGAEIGKYYVLAYVANGVFDSYGFTIYEYDKNTFASDSLSSQKMIMHIADEPFSEPDASIVTRTVVAHNGVIFVITVDYSATSFDYVNIANTNGVAYGSVIDESCYIYTNKDSKKTSYKILSVGNSFSNEAHRGLYYICRYDNIDMLTGNIYMAGQTLEGHMQQINEGLSNYSYQKRNSLEKTDTVTPNMTFDQCLDDEEWDIITIQQGSGLSGVYESFEPYLTDLINYMKVRQPNAKIALHMTWAYSSNSTEPSFGNYDNNQNIMYQSIVNAYLQAAKEHDIDLIIPSGTAIQNARTNNILNAIGDELTQDTTHLEDAVGEKIVGFTWYASLFTGNNDIGIEKLSYSNLETGSTPFLMNLAKIAAKNAVINPFAITSV